MKILAGLMCSIAIVMLVGCCCCHTPAPTGVYKGEAAPGQG